MEDFSGLQLYLSKRLPEHTRDHILDTMEIKDGTPEYEEEYESHMRLMEMSLWRNGMAFETAMYMEVPRKALYRFGFSNKRIDEEFEQEGHSGPYPY